MAVGGCQGWARAGPAGTGALVPSTARALAVSATVNPPGTSRWRRRTATTARTAEQSQVTSSAPLAAAISAALSSLRLSACTADPSCGVNAASAAMSAAVWAAALAPASAPMSTAATPASSTNPVNASPATELIGRWGAAAGQVRGRRRRWR